jgi:hypothetical protein
MFLGANGPVQWEVQRIIPRGHGVVDARLQISQPTQHADNPPADLRLATLVGEIELDTIKED